METNKELKQWPRTYQIRKDGSILLPPELLLVLDWKVDDKMQITIGPAMIEIRKVEKLSEATSG